MPEAKKTKWISAKKPPTISGVYERNKDGFHMGRFSYYSTKDKQWCAWHSTVLGADMNRTIRSSVQNAEWRGLVHQPKPKNKKKK